MYQEDCYIVRSKFAFFTLILYSSSTFFTLLRPINTRTSDIYILYIYMYIPGMYIFHLPSPSPPCSHCVTDLSHLSRERCSPFLPLLLSSNGAYPRLVGVLGSCPLLCFQTNSPPKRHSDSKMDDISLFQVNH